MKEAQVDAFRSQSATLCLVQSLVVALAYKLGDGSNEKAVLLGKYGNQAVPSRRMPDSMLSNKQVSGTPRAQSYYALILHTCLNGDVAHFA